MEYEYLKEFVDKGLSTYEIAYQIQKSPTNVRYWLDKYGLKTSKRKISKESTGNCICCSKPLSYGREQKQKLYCDNSCQMQHRFLTITLPSFEKGEASAKSSIRAISYLLGYKCNECGNTGIHNGKALSLQLDHVDGNAGNNMPNNLRLLCPNCHTQTPTYGAKNKGSGRGSRGLKR